MSQKHENPADSQTPKTFEQALAELEKIGSEVEQGQVGLEQTIEKYEQGMKLFNIAGKSWSRPKNVSKKSHRKTLHPAILLRGSDGILIHVPWCVLR